MGAESMRPQRETGGEYRCTGVTDAAFLGGVWPNPLESADGSDNGSVGNHHIASSQLHGNVTIGEYQVSS